MRIKIALALVVVFTVTAASGFALLWDDGSVVERFTAEPTPTSVRNRERDRDKDTPTPAPPTPDALVIDLPPLEGKIDPPKYEDMDSILNDLVESVEEEGLSAEEVAATMPFHQGDSVGVTIYFEEGNTESIAQFLGENGGDARNLGPTLIEGYVPVLLLPELSERDGVEFVEIIIPPQVDQIPNDLVALYKDVQRDIRGLSDWRNAVFTGNGVKVDGFTGEGVKVGVIDRGFEGLDELLNKYHDEYHRAGNDDHGVLIGGARCYEEIEIGIFEDHTAEQMRTYDEDNRPRDFVIPDDCEGKGNHGTWVVEALLSIAPKVELYISNPDTVMENWIWGLHGPWYEDSLYKKTIEFDTENLHDADGPDGAVNYMLANGVKIINIRKAGLMTGRAMAQHGRRISTVR